MSSKRAGRSSAAGGLLPYDGELASSILLEEGDGVAGEYDGSGLRQPPYHYSGGSGQPSHFGGRGAAPFFPGDFGGGFPEGHGASSSAPHIMAQRGLDYARRANNEAPHRTPTRTPSPVYQWNHPKEVSLNEDQSSEPSYSGTAGKRTSSGSRATTAADQQVFAHVPFPPFYSPYWSGMMNPAQAQAYYGVMMGNSLFGSPGSTVSPGVDGDGASSLPDPSYQASRSAPSRAARQTGPTLHGSAPATAEEDADVLGGPPAPWSGPGGPGPLVEEKNSEARAGKGGLGANAVAAGGKRAKGRNKSDRAAEGNVATATPRERGPGAKSERRRRGGSGSNAAGAAIASGEDDRTGGGGGKPRSDTRGVPSSSPVIEQLKARERNLELSDLAANISEIAQDQQGSRMIQQKLEVASDEEKAFAFKSVLQKLPQLTTDVFGNYVIQKFFEYGSPEQRRILAEQLVGQVLRLSLQMYGCRVVQKALESVPMEQQVLLVGELKGHVITCIEDQHGNHVIQKCIERLPTDRLNFVVESFQGHVSRMAKHCYGCRVIQRLIEYCSSAQISALLDEVLRSSMDLAMDQYGNYVVQHVMEHSNRTGDRQTIMLMVRKHMLSLSCHKYASNVVEKALSCGTVEERALLTEAILGEFSADPAHPPLLTMMRDRYGNYIVQRTITFSPGPQHEALLWKLHEQLPALKKSNPYGKHIITALEKAQAALTL